MAWTQGHRNIQHALNTVATGEASEKGPDQQASNDVQACQETRRATIVQACLFRLLQACKHGFEDGTRTTK